MQKKSKESPSQVLIKDLQSILSKNASLETKKWFENYLKGAIKYRGLKTPQVQKIVYLWRKKHSLQNLPTEKQLKIAASLLKEPYAEDKFAGMLYLQKYLLKKVALDELITLSSHLYDGGHIFDWSTADWYTVRVLQPLIREHERKAVLAITDWHKSTVLWKKRASVVALRECTREKSSIPQIKKQITVLLPTNERFIQTGIGWVISDLSKNFEKAASTIIEKHFSDLSLEVIKRHTKYMEKHRTYVSEKKRLNQNGFAQKNTN